QPFEISEMRLAPLLKDLGNRASFAPLDFRIEIDKLPAQFFRDPPANRAFPGAHETDKVNSIMCHSQSLYFRIWTRNTPVLLERTGPKRHRLKLRCRSENGTGAILPQSL